jgi:hypothetical protein
MVTAVTAIKASAISRSWLGQYPCVLFVNTTRGFHEFFEILKVPAMRPPQRLFGSRLEEDHFTLNAAAVKRKFYFESRVFGPLSR